MSQITAEGKNSSLKSNKNTQKYTKKRHNKTPQRNKKRHFESRRLEFQKYLTPTTFHRVPIRNAQVMAN